MKKIITTNIGGMPIVLDDLNFIQDSYTEIINAIVAHDATNPVIISGCKYNKGLLEDTGTLDMTAGFIFLAGEIYAVDAVNTSLGTGESFYWIIDTSYDSAGSKVFESLINYNTYEVKKAQVLKANPIPGGKIAFTTTKSIFDIYREGITDSVNESPMLSYVNNFTTELSNPFLGKTGVSGEVILSGLITNTNGLSVSDLVIGTMKSEFRPSEPVYVKVMVLSNAYNYLEESVVVIEPTGQVKFVSKLTASYINPKVVMNCVYLK